LPTKPTSHFAAVKPADQNTIYATEFPAHNSTIKATIGKTQYSAQFRAIGTTI
jgi:hypothetical protein